MRAGGGRREAEGMEMPTAHGQSLLARHKKIYPTKGGDPHTVWNQTRQERGQHTLAWFSRPHPSPLPSPPPPLSDKRWRV